MRLMKRGRKCGIILLLVTQSPSVPGRARRAIPASASQTSAHRQHDSDQLVYGVAAQRGEPDRDRASPVCRRIRTGSVAAGLRVAG